MYNEWNDFDEYIDEDGKRVRVWHDDDDWYEPEDRPEWHEMGS